MNFVGLTNGETAYSNKQLFDTTNPAALGSAGPGSQVIAARRDHVHAMPTLDGVAAPTDVTTLNATTSAHGLIIKATAGASGNRNVVAIDYEETTYKNTALFDATNPAMNGSASPGTALTVARRDHVHASDTSKQDALGYTAENSANKENTTIDTSTTKYPTVNLLKTVQDTAYANLCANRFRTVRCATTGNITISTALNNGDTIDGITLVTGDPVLVWQQTTASQQQQPQSQQQQQHNHSTTTHSQHTHNNNHTYRLILYCNVIVIEIINLCPGPPPVHLLVIERSKRGEHVPETQHLEHVDDNLQEALAIHHSEKRKQSTFLEI
jgi:hypothetical protein